MTLSQTLDNGITLDNGLTFGSRVDFEDGPISEQLDVIDEEFLFVRGSFGRILLDSDDDSYRNARRPEDFTAGGCAQFGADGQLGAHVPFSLKGLGLSVGYTGFLDDNSRGALATEDSNDINANLVNPAVDFDYRLGGARFDAAVAYCLDTGRLLPSTLSASFNYSQLGATDSVSNIALPYGLGITGVGYAPGVFINSPTDIEHGTFDLDRTAFGGGLEYSQPLGIRMSDRNRAALSAKIFGVELARINSLIMGLDFGAADQDETTEFTTNTPAFGVNSGAHIRYDTSFDINNYNLKLGLQHERHAVNGNGTFTSAYLRGTVGYSYVEVDAYDSIRASGLGGAVNIDNSNRIHESDGMETATIEAGISRTNGNVSGGFSLGLNYGGVPVLDYHRPDSDINGALDPVIDIGGDWSANISAGIRLKF
ncbi:hypothetical protein [Roseovarius ramblicola]|uniref:Outer membrane protein transport protein (OMPP1/FadL/TodX) n=1 Tax=Roseovarius ramblicola TaxID=2022336 RepID=A0ABV5HYS9_9RHOB